MRTPLTDRRVRAELILKGTVQGVGFRAYIQRHAVEQEVTGLVRNRPDGTVEVVLEGDEHRVQHVVDRCVMGPPAALVKSADLTWVAFTGAYDAFRIVT